MTTNIRRDLVVVSPLALAGLGIIGFTLIFGPPTARYVVGGTLLMLLPTAAIVAYAFCHDEIAPAPGEPVAHLPGSWVKQALLTIWMLSMAVGCALILVFADWFEPRQVRAWVVGLLGVIVFGFLGAVCTRDAIRPMKGLRVDDAGLHVLETGECLGWRELASVELDNKGLRLMTGLRVTMRSGEVRQLELRGAPASRHTLPALIAYAQAKTAA